MNASIFFTNYISVGYAVFILYTLQIPYIPMPSSKCVEIKIPSSTIYSKNEYIIRRGDGIEID